MKSGGVNRLRQRGERAQERDSLTESDARQQVKTNVSKKVTDTIAIESVVHNADRPDADPSR